MIINDDDNVLIWGSRATHICVSLKVVSSISFLGTEALQSEEQQSAQTLCGPYESVSNQTVFIQHIVKQQCWP